MGSLHPNIAPYGEIFRTKEGVQLTLAIGSDAHFHKLCQILLLDELVNDERFITNQQRLNHRKELADILSDKLISEAAEEFLNRCNQMHIPAARIKNIEEVFQEGQAQKLVREEVISKKETKRVTSIAFKWK